MKKKNYDDPLLTLISMQEDIITTSGETDPLGGGNAGFDTDFGLPS